MRSNTLLLLVLGGMFRFGTPDMTAGADLLRTQVIQLHQGWNAVFLEVQPADSDPIAVFADTPVDVAAAYHARSSTAQFMVNPSVDLFRQAGWGVWYAPSRPDAFLKTLHAIYGQQAYLLHARSDYRWKVQGTVIPPDIRWRSGAYNLVGFGIHPQAGPTFAQFFSGSRAHRQFRIYRLANGTWRRVSDASAETMRSGEAFWIYCDGASRYQGPLRVETTTRHGVLLGDQGDALVLRNDTDFPVSPTVAHVPAGSDPVPLSIVVQAVGDEQALVRNIAAPQPDGPWTQPLPPLEARNAIQVPLEARRGDMRSSVQGSLLKVTTDLGTEVWIPVLGVRKDLADQ